MKVTVKFGSDTSPNIRRLRKWGDPVLVSLLGASTALVGTSNFQVVKLCTLTSSGILDFNDVAKYQVVDEGYLRSLQFEEIFDGRLITVEQKMNWLINREGVARRPYWMDGGSALRFGTILFGGQLVKIDPLVLHFDGQYPGRNYKESIPVHRVIGVRRSDFGNITHKSDSSLVQKATAANRTPVEDSYDDAPKGTIYHPVWSDIDFPPNYGNGKLYICSEFLE